MKGWGSVACLIGLGLSVASGCGSRTAGFDDFYYGSGDDDDDDSVGGSAIGGMGAVSGKGGSSATAGKAPIGGAGIAGSTPIGGTFTAGTSPIGGGGFTAGTSPTGGTGVGGFVIGGAAGFGAVPIGGFGGVSPMCQTCLFDSCAGQFLECLQDIGCIEIIACAQQTRCQGVDCYSADTCKKVIDAWGGPAGPSMNELLQTFSCAVNAGCPCMP